MKNLVVFFLISLVVLKSSGQTVMDSAVQKKHILGSISLFGNKKTKDKIILREIPAKLGDTINADELSDLLKKSQQNIINTSFI